MEVIWKSELIKQNLLSMIKVQHQYFLCVNLSDNYLQLIKLLTECQVAIKKTSYYMFMYT